jgi:hypothetical protein
MRKLLFLLIAVITISCSSSQQNSPSTLSPGITAGDLRAHFNFLSQDTLHNREMGSPGAAVAARYIAGHFRKIGLQPMSDDSTYYQQFAVNLAKQKPRQSKDTADAPETRRIVRNVIGSVKGTRQPNTYILIATHNDNAPGISGVLELAQYYSRHQSQKTLLFTTFTDNEFQHYGSHHFVHHPVIPLDSIEAVINLGNIGGLTNNKLTILGTGTSKGWAHLINQAQKDSLSIRTVAGLGDTVNSRTFYHQKISVLDYSTSDHSFNAKKTVNFKGEVLILDQIKNLITELDTLSTNQLPFSDH